MASHQVAKSELEERKRIEKEREKLVLELEAKNQELESFVYTVSHVLRSPLVSISGFSTNLQQRYRDKLDERGSHYLQRLQANVAHMEDLITNLLELSRIGRVVGEMTPIDMDAFLETILETLSGEIKDSQAEIIIQKPLPTIHADRIRLGQVFANILDNAIKFRQPERDLQIEIGCQEEELDFLFFVRDNGIGIDPRYKDKILVPFQKLNPEIKGSMTGGGNSAGLKTATAPITIVFRDEVADARNERTGKRLGNSRALRVDWTMNEAIVVSFKTPRQPLHQGVAP